MALPETVAPNPRFNVWPVGDTPVFTFDVTFPFEKPEELEVYLSSNPSVPKVRNVDYVVAGAGGASGQITFLADGVVNDTVLILGWRLAQREQRYLDEPLDVAALNQDSNRLWRTMQELQSNLRQSVFTPFRVGQQTRLIMPEWEAGALLGWDESNPILKNYPTGTTPTPPPAGGGSMEQLYGLIDDGVTDQSGVLETLIETAVAEGWPEISIRGKTDGSSQLRLGRRISASQMPGLVSFERIKVVVDPNAGFFVRAREVELPATGKAKLWSDVSVSSGAVATFDIDVSANPSIVGLMVPGAPVIVRGQNDAAGEALDGHVHEANVVSLVLVSGTRYTLTLDAGLPNATGIGGVWRAVWPNSEHEVVPDETLISVVATAFATADLTDSREMSIANGRAAALGIVAGSWVEVRDDAVGSDFHGESDEPLHRQMVRVQSVTAGAGADPDVLRFDDVIRGALTVAKRARAVLLDSPPKAFELRGPGPGFPVRMLGVPDPEPASRRHFIETRYCIKPLVTNWVWAYEPLYGYRRGAFVRDSLSWRPTFRHCWWDGQINTALAEASGDLYGLHLKGSAFPIIEHCRATGGRHGIVFGGTKHAIIRFNEAGGSLLQCIDAHGENEIDSLVYGNRVIRGMRWDGRSKSVAFQFGNTFHTFGTRNLAAWGNEVAGFNEEEDTGYLIVSGARDVVVDVTGNADYARLVHVNADNRAPDVLIERVSINGTAGIGDLGALIDGRMQVWESGGEVEATASRPVYIDDDTGTRRYMTEDTGTLGVVNPTHVAGAEANGDVTLTYVGLVADQTVPIQGVKIMADLAGAATTVEQYRAINVELGDNSAILAPVALSGDYADLINRPVLGSAAAAAATDFATAGQGTLAASALQPAGIAAGAITPAAGTLNLTGSNGQVLALDGAGNIAPLTLPGRVTFGGVTYDNVIAGANVSFSGAGSQLTINVSSGTATLGDGGYGDVTVSSSGTVITINGNAVTNAKLAQMAEARVKGRAAGAGLGDPVDLTPAEIRTLINVADGANAYAHPNHTGEVTSTGDGATVITAGAVTEGKIGAGAVTGAKLADGAVTTAKLANYGAYEVVVRAGGTTGAPAAVAASANGVLRRDGTGNLGFGSIKDGNIDAAAAIALSKLATNPLDRGNHTGTQAIATILGLQTALDAKAAGAGSSVDDRVVAFSGTTGKTLKQAAFTAAEVAAALANVPPAGNTAIITRDLAGDLVAAEDAPDGTIVIDADGVPRAVAKLGADVVDELPVTESKALSAADEGIATVTETGLPSKLRKRVLRVLADPPTTPVVLTVADNCPSLSDVAIIVDGTQTGPVTLATGAAGYINGSGPSVSVQIPRGRLFPVTVQNPTATSPRVTTGFTVEDGKLERLSASGTLTLQSHMGKVVTTSGNVVIPTTAGFHCVLEFGGADTATFNGTTFTGAAGDGLVVMVLTPTLIWPIEIKAADLAAFV